MITQKLINAFEPDHRRKMRIKHLPPRYDNNTPVLVGSDLIRDFWGGEGNRSFLHHRFLWIAYMSSNCGLRRNRVRSRLVESTKSLSECIKSKLWTLNLLRVKRPSKFYSQYFITHIK